MGTLGTLDSYLGPAHNYYLYVLDGRFTVIPWDFNGAFGIFNCGCDRDAIVAFAIDEPSCWRLDDRPLIGRLLSNDTWRETYRGYVRELLDGPLAEAVFAEKVRVTGDLIEPFVREDERAFYSIEEFRDNLDNDHVERDGRVLPGLTAFVRDRAASLRAPRRPCSRPAPARRRRAPAPRRLRTAGARTWARAAAAARPRA